MPRAKEAPLIPKLQGQFAEFLKRRYLDHLNILNQPTCVGLVRLLKLSSRYRFRIGHTIEQPERAVS